MRLRKLGHSCLLAADDGYRLLIDPGCFAAGLAKIRDLTAVLITHIHDDHLDAEQLRAVLDLNPGLPATPSPIQASRSTFSRSRSARPG